MTEQQQSKQIREDYLLSLRQVAVGPPPPLTTDEMSRIINTIPRLSKLAVANFSTVLDRITTKHQRLLLRHSRRFEYEFRSRFLGGKKKNKKTGERVSVLLGEFMSKHVFMPKTQHLIKNGDILFLQLFNMFLHEQWDEISLLRKDIGFYSFRSDESLERILDNLHNEMMLIGDVSNGKNGYWLKGLAVEKKKEKVVFKETREERRRKKELRKIKRREEHENKKLMSKSREKNDDGGEGGNGGGESKTSKSSTDRTQLPKQQKERRHSQNPERYEEYVDETGVRVWRDLVTGRTITSEDLRSDVTETDPYEGWSIMIDGSGRKIHIHPTTGEAVYESSSSSSSSSSRETRSRNRSEGKKKTLRKSLAHRAVRKVGKWFSAKKKVNREETMMTAKDSTENTRGGDDNV